jgi:putative peptide zinc metalloprotease protein
VEVGIISLRESLFSPLWHRYAQQRPQLRSHVTVQPQRYRDQTWYLLINEVNGVHFRINDVAYQFVGRCDGNYSVQEVWDSMLESLADDTPTQDELIRLIGELDQRDLILYQVMTDIPTLFRRKQEKVKRERLAFINPLSFKLSLWDPTKFLDKTRWLQKIIFNPYAFVIWLIVVVSALFAAVSDWDALRLHASNYMTTPKYLFLAWLSFPFIKVLHELGHALAVRNWDGHVKEFGITFFVFTPAPYVDASASSAFRSQFQRVIVGAMGMMVELLLASIALLIWFSTQSGLVHALAFVIMFVCSVTSLLFNGNPLLRFDAYHILCDTFDLPNLANRSRFFWTTQFKRIVLGAKNMVPMSYAQGERKWLFAYAPLSIVYGLIILGYIVFWLGSKSFVIGLLVALFAIVAMIIKPLVTTIKNIIESAGVGTARNRAKMVVASILGLSFVLLFIVPVPFNTIAQGVIWLPDQAQIRPLSEGFIKEIIVPHGAEVEPNQVILVLSDPNLIARRDNLNSQLSSLQVNQYNLLSQDITRAENISKQIEKIGAELKRVNEQIDALEIRSQVKGKLVMPHQNDLIGTFVKQGALLAYVLNRNIIKIRAAIPEPSAALLSDNLTGVQVRTVDHPNNVILAKMSMETPAVTRTLPSAALGDHGGGDYATDPADKDGLTAVEPLVLIDLNLPETNLERVGARASVRFDHGYAPIAVQLYRHLRQLFLRYFNPAN